MSCCTQENLTRPEAPPFELDATHHPFRFINRQGMYLRWMQWAPPVGTATRAVMFLSHGVCEHAGRYDYIAMALTKQGVHVFAHDHQGHGGSEAFQQTPAFFQRFEDLVDDLLLFVQQRLVALPAALSTVPRFLFGHSMGSLVALRAVEREPSLFTGVLLSGATLYPAPELATPFKRFLARTFSRLAPTVTVGGIDDSTVSLNESYLESMRRDPMMVRGGLTARWGHEMLEANDRARKELGKVTCPILLLHGGDDKITAIEGSRIVMREAMKSYRAMYTFEGKYHDIFSHTDVFDDAVALCVDFVWTWSGGVAGTPAAADVKARYADILCPPQTVEA